MFTIIKKGHQKVFYWGNANSPCENCGCIFRCDEEDTEIQDYHYNEKSEKVEIRTAPCPCCSIINHVEEFYDFVEFEKMELTTENWTIRTQNVFALAGLKTFEDLLKLSEREFYKNKNVGRKTMAEIKEHLAKYGLTLKQE